MQILSGDSSMNPNCSTSMTDESYIFLTWIARNVEYIDGIAICVASVTNEFATLSTCLGWCKHITWGVRRSTCYTVKVLINLLYNRGEFEVQQLREKNTCPRTHTSINIHINLATIILMLPNIQTRNMTYQHWVTYSNETVMQQVYFKMVIKFA